jgi:hypothetical protein
MRLFGLMAVVGRWMDRWGGSGGKRTEVEAETVHRKGGETCDIFGRGSM